MAQDQNLTEQAGWESAQEYFRESERVKAVTPTHLTIRKSDVEIKTLADWRLYASPRAGDSQWRDYRSAKELARAWCPDGIGPTIPPETGALLSSHTDLSGFRISEVLPEYRVRFDDLPGEPRNADVMAIGAVGEEQFVLSVEGRCDEPFGAYIGDELTAAARRIAREQPANSFARITRLADALLRPRAGGEPHLGELRYQLLVSLAGALATATQRGAPRAVFMVHEFRTHITNDSLLVDNQRDLERLVARLTNGAVTAVPMNQLIGPLHFPGNEHISPNVGLYLGKVRRELLALDF
jgi:hypothetical protein